MSFKFDNQGSNVYLAYEIEPDDVVDTMSLGMLTNNKIRGFAPAVYTQLDSSRYIKYNVSSKVTVAQMFSGLVNKKHLLGVLSGIVNAMISAEDYMIDPSSMLLDLDYMFADVSTCETVMICLPIIDMTKQAPDLSTFFKQLIFNIKFDQSENCDHVAQILNYLNGMSAFTLADFKQLLDNLSRTPSQPAARPAAPAPQPAAPAPQPVAAPAPQPAAAPAQPVAAPVQHMQITSQPTAPATPGTRSISSQPAAKPITSPAPQMAMPNGAVIVSTSYTDPDPNDPNNPANAGSGEKPMSFLYLMRHYNKENAEAYKAQKNAPKPEKPAKAEKPKRGKKGKNEPDFSATGFQVPGAPSAGFQVPGAPSAAPVTRAPGAQPQAAAPSAPVRYQYNPPVAAAPVNNGPIQFGETTVLGGGAAIGETTVLNAQPTAPVPYLVREKTGERIPLSKDLFRIGKERSYVDYFISDNPAISRSHANIITREGVCYVVDTNSTNHTYVNGMMLPASQETRLNHGDTVRLGNEDFAFKMY